jgi:hypothetical protein
MKNNIYFCFLSNLLLNINSFVHSQKLNFTNQVCIIKKVKLKAIDIYHKQFEYIERPSVKHKINFNQSNIIGGIYSFKLQTGNFTQSKKMILLQ